MNKVISLVGIVLLVTISVWIVLKFVMKKKTTEKYEDARNTYNTPKLILVHATWCKHCVEYLNDTKYDGKNAFDAAGDALQQQIRFEKLDFDENKELISGYGVSSFPSIVGIDTSGNVKQFSGDRDNMDAIIEFARLLS